MRPQFAHLRIQRLHLSGSGGRNLALIGQIVLGLQIKALQLGQPGFPVADFLLRQLGAFAFIGQTRFQRLGRIPERADLRLARLQILVLLPDGLLARRDHLAQIADLAFQFGAQFLQGIDIATQAFHLCQAGLQRLAIDIDDLVLIRQFLPGLLQRLLCLPGTLIGGIEAHEKGIAFIIRRFEGGRKLTDIQPQIGIGALFQRQHFRQFLHLRLQLVERRILARKYLGKKKLRQHEYRQQKNDCQQQCRQGIDETGPDIVLIAPDRPA